MRCLAITLPDLLCELAALGRESRVGVGGALSLDAPLAVVVAARPEELRASARLSAVSLRARKAGVYAGQRASVARALLASLEVVRVSPDEVRAALARIAELGLRFCPTVALEGDDTVLLDVTGVGHLHGGEETLVHEVAERVRALGHRVRAALAEGPRIARAVALHGEDPRAVVPPGDERRAMAKLPLLALPIPEDVRAFFAKTGLLSVEDLRARPRVAVAGRLGPAAADVLSLLDGEDRAPLAPYAPSQALVEELSWDDGVTGTEPLLFASRGLLARLSARLEGRGLATRALSVTLSLDRGVAALEGLSGTHELTVELPLPLWKLADLTRVLRSHLERLALGAPVVRLAIEAAGLGEAPAVQLDLSRDTRTTPEALSVLLAELVGELGEGAVGVFGERSSHLLEERSPLVPLGAGTRPRRRDEEQLALFDTEPVEPPTRLLPRLVPLEGKLVPGGLVVLDRRALTVVSVTPLERLEAVHWFRGRSREVTRDAATVVLADEAGVVSCVVVRQKGRTYVQALSA